MQASVTRLPARLCFNNDYPKGSLGRYLLLLRPRCNILAGSTGEVIFQAGTPLPALRPVAESAPAGRQAAFSIFPYCSSYSSEIRNSRMIIQLLLQMGTVRLLYSFVIPDGQLAIIRQSIQNF